MRRLLGRRVARLEAGQFVVEGPTLVAEALRAGLLVTDVFVDEQADRGGLVAGFGRLHIVASGVLERVLSTVSPQPWAAVVELPSTTATDVVAARGPVVVLAGVQDPGNVGTVIRAAEAAGAAGILTMEGTADPFSPKVVRSSAGSVLRVPVAPVADDEFVGLVRQHSRRLIVTAMAGTTDLWSSAIGDDSVLVLGNEAAGVPSWLMEHADVALSIPMQGEVESLNVAMAATLVLFEAARTRSQPGTTHPGDK